MYSFLVKERNLDSILDSTTVKERNLSDARQYCESPYYTLSRLPPVHRWRHATALAAHGLPGTAVHVATSANCHVYRRHGTLRASHPRPCWRWRHATAPRAY